MEHRCCRLLRSFGAKDSAVATALQRRPELLTEERGTALERYRAFCDVLKGFGLRRAVAREVCNLAGCKLYWLQSQLWCCISAIVTTLLCPLQCSSFDLLFHWEAC